MSETVLQCKHLTKSFIDGQLNVEVFNGIDFSVSPGEMIAIMGPSGAGKSTFMHLLGGLDTPTSGEVTLMGQAFSTVSESKKAKMRNQYLGFVYQFHHLLPEFDAVDNVAMPLLIRGDRVTDAKDKAAHLLGQVGLGARLTHRLSELSGGERQRVALARALVTEPSCVLADEPTGNLDSKTAGSVFDLMIHLNEQSGTSFVIVTHDDRLANRMQKTLMLDDMLLSSA